MNFFIHNNLHVKSIHSFIQKGYKFHFDHKLKAKKTI